ncbi:UNVERIFIED_CONTAM: Tartrate-resistant acid phosphatase type 5 [Siphonaria sp. JEL0065]|nr:Tartrate-resistant acid phosphatase type 5 [Siphonaria sp. JEL0065]
MRLVIFLISALFAMSHPTKRADSKRNPYLSVLLIGDWGNQLDLSDEINIATTMNSWAEEHKSTCVISLGDNFYKGGNYSYDGLNSPEDAKFHALWSQVFTGATLAKLPWWVVLGNHDWLEIESHRYEIEYTHERWHIPDIFYTKRVKVPGQKNHHASFIFIETDLLQYGYYPPNNMSTNFLQLGWTPEDRTAEKQLAWLDNELHKANKDEFVFVVGHHGGFTCAEEVESSFAIKNMTALVNKYNATAFIHGHHHTLAYYYTNNNSTLQVQSGAGGNIDGACAPVSDAVGAEMVNIYGFTHLRVYEDYVHFEFVTEKDSVVFEAFMKRRKPAVGVKVDKTYLAGPKDPSVHFKKAKKRIMVLEQ